MSKYILLLMMLMVRVSEARVIDLTDVVFRKCTSDGVCLVVDAKKGNQSLLGDIMSLNQAEIFVKDRTDLKTSKRIFAELVIIDQSGGEVSWYDGQGKHQGSIRI